MLYLLDHIRSAVWTMHVYKLSLLVYEGLVSFRSELLPKIRELGCHANHSTGLDIKITGIIPWMYGFLHRWTI